MVSNSSNEDIGALVFWLIIFSLFAVVAYIGFFGNSKHSAEHDSAHLHHLWYCSVVTSEHSMAQRFDELAPGAQAFLIRMRDDEKRMFDKIPEILKIYETTLMSLREKANSGADISMYAQEIETLKALENQPKEWEIHKSDFYSCIRQ